MYSIFLLGIPSIVVLGLLIFYLLANFTRTRALVYLGAVIFYGIIRATLLQHLVKTEYGSLFPYLMNLPVLKLGAVSLQEIIGWTVAASISWLISDRILRRFKLTPGPYQTAFMAFFSLAAICLAVETAAIESGWWIWTIKQPRNGIFGKVPLVGMLDWGFVAFDFLLPFLLFASRTPLRHKIASLTLFPLHFFSHPKTQPFAEPLSLAWNDLMHGAILAYVLMHAIDERREPVLPEPQAERRRWIPLACALIVASATIASDTIAGNFQAAAASFPLIILAAAAFALPWPAVKEEQKVQARPEKKRARQKVVAPVAREMSWKTFWMRIAAVAVIFAITYGFRAPFHRKTQYFLSCVQKGVNFLNTGNLDAAETEFRKGIQARPDQPGGYLVLGQLLMRKGDREAARIEFQKTLELNQTNKTALVLLTTLDLQDQRWGPAEQRAAFGKKIYPDQPEFLYQLAVARKEQHKIAEAIAVARQGGAEARNALANVALSLGDQATATALAQ